MVEVVGTGVSQEGLGLDAVFPLRLVDSMLERVWVAMAVMIQAWVKSFGGQVSEGSK